ncbi:hypothetical protein TOPH_02471 [Tolypocladium ophioglossoides CBS 100239]|uniref:Rhodopsin domain-containing protein n=1 Tax=Tolypocladium ophioglossoides (strain CBS 100239) TaxID=1163406 RepID=A0A0L0NHK0_TOLOC|nr:hypothetical protein TOPH_02471 [Tolypocladium ophioglossoides CBS 100239]
MATAEAADRGPELLGVNIAFCVLAGLIVLLRCYTRAVLVKAFGLDDWLMIVATAFFLVYIVVSNLSVHYGTGQHMANLDPENIKNALMYWWFCYLFFCLTMVSSKLSFALFLLRITTTRIHAWIIHSASLGVVVAGIVFFFVTLFQCRPISYFWDRGQPGECLEMDVIMAIAYLYSAFSVITDFTFAILPGFVIWNLKLNARAKFALIVLIAMGCAASSAVVVRFGYLMRFKDPDFLWATIDIAIWSTVEMGLAIGAASLATLRPLVKMAAWKLGISSQRTTITQTPYGATMPPRSIPNNPEGGNQFDRNVYVMSEIHVKSGNDSQEKLHERDVEVVGAEEHRKKGAPKSFLRSVNPF